MPLPSGLRFSLDVVDFLPVIDDSRNEYRQGPIRIRAGEPLGWVNVSWPGHAVARIEEYRPGARVLLTRESRNDFEKFARGFLLIVLIFLWKRDRRFHVHAGTARDPAGRGWMLAGNSGTGKSTTIALLARRGWEVGADDISFLVDCGERVGVMGFRERIALRPGGADQLGLPDAPAPERRGKSALWPEELGGRWVATVEPDVVVFTGGLGSRTVLSRAEPRDILAGLIQSSAWVMFEKTGATEHLELLARLGRQARFYHATLGPDLFQHPEALAGFLP